ncbi:uncharacterized protein LOC134265469 [Saccostrea cucullata]|uniref:uncharacterized protein LOC134265469 n=1 Tax=Saccostrea cuccullata TaxID=36930 RepID=UPI002ED09035
MEYLKTCWNLFFVLLFLFIKFSVEQGFTPLVFRGFGAPPPLFPGFGPPPPGVRTLLPGPPGFPAIPGPPPLPIISPPVTTLSDAGTGSIALSGETVPTTFDLSGFSNSLQTLPATTDTASIVGQSGFDGGLITLSDPGNTLEGQNLITTLTGQDALLGGTTTSIANGLATGLITSDAGVPEGVNPASAAESSFVSRFSNSNSNDGTSSQMIVNGQLNSFDSVSSVNPQNFDASAILNTVFGNSNTDPSSSRTTTVTDNSPNRIVLTSGVSNNAIPNNIIQRQPVSVENTGERIPSLSELQQMFTPTQFSNTAQDNAIGTGGSPAVGIPATGSRTGNDETRIVRVNTATTINQIDGTRKITSPSDELDLDFRNYIRANGGQVDPNDILSRFPGPSGISTVSRTSNERMMIPSNSIFSRNSNDPNTRSRTTITEIQTRSNRGIDPLNQQFMPSVFADPARNQAATAIAQNGNSIDNSQISRPSTSVSEVKNKSNIVINGNSNIVGSKVDMNNIIRTSVDVQPQSVNLQRSDFENTLSTVGSTVAPVNPLNDRFDVRMDPVSNITRRQPSTNSQRGSKIMFVDGNNNDDETTFQEASSATGTNNQPGANFNTNLPTARNQPGVNSNINFPNNLPEVGSNNNLPMVSFDPSRRGNSMVSSQQNPGIQSFQGTNRELNGNVAVNDPGTINRELNGNVAVNDPGTTNRSFNGNAAVNDPGTTNRELNSNVAFNDPRTTNRGLNGNVAFNDPRTTNRGLNGNVAFNDPRTTNRGLNGNVAFNDPRTTNRELNANVAFNDPGTTNRGLNGNVAFNDPGTINRGLNGNAAFNDPGTTNRGLNGNAAFNDPGTTNRGLNANVAFNDPGTTNRGLNANVAFNDPGTINRGLNANVAFNDPGTINRGLNTNVAFNDPGTTNRELNGNVAINDPGRTNLRDPNRIRTTAQVTGFSRQPTTSQIFPTNNEAAVRGNTVNLDPIRTGMTDPSNGISSQTQTNLERSRTENNAPLPGSSSTRRFIKKTTTIRRIISNPNESDTNNRSQINNTRIPDASSFRVFANLNNRMNGMNTNLNANVDPLTGDGVAGNRDSFVSFPNSADSTRVPQIMGVQNSRSFSSVLPGNMGTSNSFVRPTGSANVNRQFMGTGFDPESNTQTWGTVFGTIQSQNMPSTGSLSSNSNGVVDPSSAERRFSSNAFTGNNGNSNTFERGVGSTDNVNNQSTVTRFDPVSSLQAENASRPSQSQMSRSSNIFNPNSNAVVNPGSIERRFSSNFPLGNNRPFNSQSSMAGFDPASSSQTVGSIERRFSSNSPLGNNGPLTSRSSVTGLDPTSNSQTGGSIERRFFSNFPLRNNGAFDSQSPITGFDPDSNPQTGGEMVRTMQGPNNPSRSSFNNGLPRNSQQNTRVGGFVSMNAGTSSRTSADPQSSAFGTFGDAASRGSGFQTRVASTNNVGIRPPSTGSLTRNSAVSRSVDPNGNTIIETSRQNVVLSSEPQNNRNETGNFMVQGTTLPPVVVANDTQSCKTSDDCQTGNQCTYNRNFLCPDWVDSVTCQCQPGCDAFNQFIPLGTKISIDNCGNECVCIRNDGIISPRAEIITSPRPEVIHLPGGRQVIRGSPVPVLMNTSSSQHYSSPRKSQLHQQQVSIPRVDLHSPDYLQDSQHYNSSYHQSKKDNSGEESGESPADDESTQNNPSSNSEILFESNAGDSRLSSSVFANQSSEVKEGDNLVNSRELSQLHQKEQEVADCQDISNRSKKLIISPNGRKSTKNNNSSQVQDKSEPSNQKRLVSVRRQNVTRTDTSCVQSSEVVAGKSPSPRKRRAQDRSNERNEVQGSVQKQLTLNPVKKKKQDTEEISETLGQSAIQYTVETPLVQSKAKLVKPRVIITDVSDKKKKKEKIRDKSTELVMHMWTGRDGVRRKKDITDLDVIMHCVTETLNKCKEQFTEKPQQRALNKFSSQINADLASQIERKQSTKKINSDVKKSRKNMQALIKVFNQKRQD